MRADSGRATAASANLTPLAPLTVVLQGSNLIQASAGTGKTWTVSLLYLRLLLEKQLTVDQLLVVTYTRAATDELRERIRTRLKEIVRCYQQPENGTQYPGEYQQFMALYPFTPERLWHLQRALLSFDEAAVFTIHGFCQRALKENAFEAGLPFDNELISDEYTLQLALTDRFWHQRLLEPDALDSAALDTTSLTPENLLYSVKDFIGKPYLLPVMETRLDNETCQQVQLATEQAQQQLLQLWAAQGEAIKGLLKPDIMNQQSYKSAQIEKMQQAVEALYQNKVDQKLLLKWTQSHIRAKTCKNKPVPEHVFFVQMEDWLAQYQHWQTIQQQALQQLRWDLLQTLRTQLPQEKYRAGVLAYDDLLINLHQALQQRPALASQLQQRYQVALIDEFQDTDPLQYEIFAQIYQQEQACLFYVGDPKQAIYRFRGADIHTYLRAGQGITTEKKYTLNRNFRSCPDLLAALNTLYQASADPFRQQQQIVYEPVKSGGTVNAVLTRPQPVAALRLWDWQNPDQGKPNKTEVTRMIAERVAQDIARLLQEGQCGEAHIEGKAVGSGDIAVLVRSHKQGRLIKQALQHCGIISVHKSPLSIFATQEANHLRQILAAIAEPQNMSRLRRAWVTPFMGGTALDLLALDEDDQLLGEALQSFHNLHQLWRLHGLLPMLRQWMNEYQVQQRLLNQPEGERQLTNLLHLSELLHCETQENRLGMAALLRSMKHKAEQVSSDDDNPLRLESDEDLLQIVTIHKSKGLQYPIVYCPFLWDEPSEKTATKDWFSWYDPQQQCAYLQIGQQQRELAENYHQEDSAGEQARLLYVALTRAQYHCTVVLVSGEINRFNYLSALNWLLFGHLPEADKLLAGQKQMPPSIRQKTMHKQLQQLTAGSHHKTLNWEALPEHEALRYQPRSPTLKTTGRQFTQTILPGLRIGSFSGLVAGQHAESPDYDADTLALAPQLAAAAPLPTAAPKAGMAGAERPLQAPAFPGGRQAGVCLHKMLESLDFCKPLAGQRESVIQRSLQAYGFELGWEQSACDLLENTLHTPLLKGQLFAQRLDPSFCLAQIDRSERLDEMEFYFPVKQLKVSALQYVLREHLPADWSAIHHAIKRLAFSDLKGYMKGYIDLIFRAQGRFYVVDYKSNYLGAQSRDYQQHHLQTAMGAAHYYLQYLIYCLALHRYLQQRIPRYQWDTHVGGVFYLFIRGMHPDHLDSRGIFYHKPSKELIYALDQLFQ